MRRSRVKVSYLQLVVLKLDITTQSRSGGEEADRSARPTTQVQLQPHEAMGDAQTQDPRKVLKSTRLAEPQRTSQARASEGVQTLRGTEETQGLTEVLRTTVVKPKPSVTSALK